jgi:hypothetical protein
MYFGGDLVILYGAMLNFILENKSMVGICCSLDVKSFKKAHLLKVQSSGKQYWEVVEPLRDRV